VEIQRRPRASKFHLDRLGDERVGREEGDLEPSATLKLWRSISDRAAAGPPAERAGRPAGGSRAAAHSSGTLQDVEWARDAELGDLGVLLVQDRRILGEFGGEVALLLAAEAEDVGVVLAAQ